MKVTGSILFILIVFSSCFAGKKAQTSQGLSGYVYVLTGNQMPSPGRPQSKGQGVSRAVYIYEPTTVSQATGASPLFSGIKTRLVARTKSDGTGHYTIKLPAGKYSVFIAEGSRYFAAESDGNGTLNPVEITAKTITTKNFTININAAY